MTSLKDNGAFLNSFWDLASDERERRLSAACQIVEHVKNEEGSTIDTDYALKRLVRGLGSSRESARQGFVTCLCELLISVPSIKIGTTLASIDENTKITGSIRGADERDMMFGKLFGYLALIRTGKLEDDEENVVAIFDRLVDLHKRKGWIREVVCEAVLTLLAAVNGSIVTVLIPRLKLFLDTEVQEGAVGDMAAWQVMLCVGIQHLMVSKGTGAESVKAELATLLPHADLMVPKHFQEMIPTLIEATGGFPKLHRVWDFILSSIFPMDGSRSLVKKRSVSLTQKQEDMLNTFCRFLEQHLLCGTLEKKSVAFKLTVELVRHTPAELIPVAFSKTLVKSLYSCRLKKAHPLYSLAASVLQEVVGVVASNTQCRLALASCLVQYGGANFDVQTGTKTLSHLLEGLDAEEVASHMLFLFSVLGAALAPSPITASTAVSVKAAVKTTKESEVMDVEEDQEEEEAPEDDKMASTIGAIEAIFSLVRNTRIANRVYVSAAAVGLFVRLSCFGPGRTQLPVAVEVKTPKKKSKKEDSTSAAVAGLSGLNKDIIAAIKLVEGSSDSSSSSGNGHSHFHVPAEIAELAGSKLIALLADIGSISLSVLAVPAPVAVSTDGKKWKGDKVLEKPSTDGIHSTTLIDLAVATVNYLSSTGGLALLRTAEASEEEDEDDSEGGEALVALSSVVASMKSLCPATASSLSLLDGAGDSVKALKGKASAAASEASDGTTDSDGSNISNEGAARKLRLRESFYSLLGHSLFQILTSSDVSMQALLDLATVSVRIVAESDNESSSSSSSSSSGAIDITVSSKVIKTAAKSGSDEDDDDEDDDDEEEEERPQSILFDASMELLSVTGDHVVKGVRDAVKKVWNCLCQVCEVDADVIDAAIAAVVAGDGEEELPPPEKKEMKKKEKGEKRKRPELTDQADDEGDDEEEEEDDDDDQMLVGEEALDFLSTDFGMDDGDEDDEDGLGSTAMRHLAVQHTEEADGALAQMLALRRQSRKKGLLDAQRNEYLIRNRAIDILEILIHRSESSSILLPMFLPLLRALKKLQRTTSALSPQEQRTLEQRLRTILEQKLCKKKFQLIADNDIDASETETTSTAAAVTEVSVKKGKQTKKQVEQQQQEAAAAETAKQQVEEDREVSATEMRAEVATLIVEIFKGLSSPVIALRPVALSALLCITRAAVSTANTDPDCRATIASSLRAALVEFVSKKNSRLAPKIFEELVSRYPEFCVLSFLPDLISSCESAKSAFLRAECCRFLTCILKRHKSLQGKALEAMDASLKNMVRTLGRALCSNCSSSSSSLALLEDAEKVEKADKNKKNKKSKKEAAAAADATAVTEIDSGSNIATEGKGKEKGKETRAKRLKPLLLCTKELAHLLKLGVAGEVPGKAGGVNSQALAALLVVMRSEGLTDSSNNPAIVRMVDQVVTLINSTGASSSGNSSSSNGSAVEVKSVTKEKAATGAPAAAAVVKVSKKEKKQKKEKDDGMVMGEGEAEEEDVYDDDALPIGEYVEAGAAGPKFKKKKGSKVVEAKEDRQETLDIAEKQVLKRMHADKRYRDEAEDVQTREDVGQKKKWHE